MQLAGRRYSSALGNATLRVGCFHGLLGCKRNWTQFAQQLSESAPHIQVDCFDLRDHGESPHSTGFSLDTMAADYEYYLKNGRGVPTVMVAHSMGGMALLHYLHHKYRNIPESDRVTMGLKAAVLVDIAPCERPATFFDAMLRSMRAMASLDLQKSVPCDNGIGTRLVFRSMMEVHDALRDEIPDEWQRRYYLTNIVRENTPTGQSLRWACNLPTLLAGVTGPGVLWKDSPEGEFKCPVPMMFVFGGASPYYTPQAKQSIDRYFKGALITAVPGAGHFVHIQSSSKFFDTAAPFVGSFAPQSGPV